MPPVPDSFFDCDPCTVARALLGKVLRRRQGRVWLAAAIVEAEAYWLEERGSHASQGRTKSRESLFQPPGTLYLYHSRAGDSLNVSCRGEGNAVLVKAGRPFFDERSPRASTLPRLHANNPRRDGGERPLHRLCAGQTLLCKALRLKIKEWDGRRFDEEELWLDDVGDVPPEVLVAPRLGIPKGRDEHLPYRYVDARFASAATENPLTRRALVEGRDYRRLAAGLLDENTRGPGRATRARA